MISTVLRAQRPQFASMAESWLRSGASAYGIWSGGAVLAQWPENADTTSCSLSTAIRLDGAAIGELRICGPEGREAEIRLEAEAGLIAQLVRLERDLNSMTSELIDTQDQLLAMYDLTQATRNYLTMEQILHQLAFETARLVKAEGTFLLLQGPAGELTIEHYPEPKIDDGTLSDYLKRVQSVGHAVLLNGDQLDEQFTDLHNLLLMPVQVSGKLVATLGLLNKIGGDFTSPNIKLARAIAEHAGARIENAILYQQQLDTARMQTEMELAQNVQLNLLPEAAPTVADLDLWAGSRPASQVGGDFFDFINRPDIPFMVAVGDVSGKGMPAAMLMTMMRTVIRSKSSNREGVTPERIIDRSNDELYQDFTELSMFATVFVAQYLHDKKQLRYANAGHSPVIFCPKGGPARLLEADGTAIGILPTSFSEDHLLAICRGDVLVIATDGINEARNENDELFGYDRLLRLVEQLAALPAKMIADEIYRTVKEFAAGLAQDDDQTLVVLKGA